MTATLGTTDAGNVALDVQRLIETRLLIQANSGAGKSWALRRLLEQTHGQVQHIVIDPEGEFATLREQYDYVLAGEDGDCAAEPRSAHLLARQLLELGVSAICDIYELKQHERIAFVHRFVTALVNAPKRLWHPVLVVVDEAHVFCPERGKAESGAAIIDLATRGRKRGMCAVLATQRLSKLRKDAAAELNNMMIGRTGLDVDMARAADALGLVGRDQRQALRFLKPGQFYAFGPALPDGVTRVTVGDVQTTHPTAGHRVATTPPPPTDRIRDLLSTLTDLPAAAEKEARDLDSYRREVASLRATVRRLEKASGPDAAEIRRRVAEATAPLEAALDSEGARRTALERYVAAWDAYGNEIDRVADRLREATDNRPAPLGEQPGPPPPAALPTRGRYAKNNSGNNLHPNPTSAPSTGAQPTRPQQAILDALALLDAMGIDAPPRSHVAAFAGASPRSSAFTNNLGRLRTLGLLDYPSGGLVALTTDGRMAAAVVDVPPTPADLRERWLDLVTAPQGRLLRALFDRWPAGQTREDLAAEAEASPKSSAFTNNLGRLRSLGLIDYITFDGERQVRAADDLFDVHATSKEG
ncbi:MAG: DUF87 domain-containing protein [Chloroflexi bacterium]|nr:DUF87 domain-containing protein [Chloroflexota bacterium]